MRTGANRSFSVRRVVEIQCFMRSVAIRRVLGLLTPTDPDRFGFLGRKNDRLESGSLMAAVTKRLLGGKAARAIGVVLARFQLDLDGRVGCSFWFFHDVIDR